MCTININRIYFATMKSFSLRSSASVGVSFLLLVLITILSLNCRKFDLGASEKTKKDNPFNVKNAKEWWFGEFKKSTAYRQINENSPLFVKLDNNTVNKIPSWKRAVEYKIGKWDIVETPLFYSEQKVLLPSMQALNYEERLKVANSTITRMLLIKLPNDSVVVRTMTVVPTLQYASKINYDISGFRFNKFLKDFDGYIFISDWSGKLINSFNLRKGNVGKKLKFVKNENITHKAIEANSAVMSSGGMCLEWVPNMVRGCIGIPDGDEPPELDCEEWREDGGSYEFVECEGGEGDPHGDCYTNGGTPEECACMMMGIGCNDGGGNGDGNNDPPPSNQDAVDEIINLLNDLCKHNALLSISNPKIQNFVTSYYNKFLLPIDSKISLTFKEANNLTHNGVFVPAYSVETSPGNWEISLSSNYFTGTGFSMSTEAWGAIIAHEILHVVIKEEELHDLGTALDHGLMFRNFTEPLRDLLVDAFGLSSEEATELALSGINDMWAYPDFETLSIREYGVSFADMDATFTKYTKGDGGVKCE